jgi:hypothetical protein
VHQRFLYSFTNKELNSNQPAMSSAQPECIDLTLLPFPGYQQYSCPTCRLNAAAKQTVIELVVFSEVSYQLSINAVQRKTRMSVEALSVAKVLVDG